MHVQPSHACACPRPSEQPERPHAPTTTTSAGVPTKGSAVASLSAFRSAPASAFRSAPASARALAPAAATPALSEHAGRRHPPHTHNSCPPPRHQTSCSNSCPSRHQTSQPPRVGRGRGGGQRSGGWELAGGTFVGLKIQCTPSCRAPMPATPPVMSTIGGIDWAGISQRRPLLPRSWSR